MQLTDSRLLAGLRSGDEPSFASLFARHWPVVYRVAYKLLGRREEAEDLSQEVFVRLYRNPPRLEEEASLGPWLYRVATNLGYNALRRYAREGLRSERAQRELEVEQSARVDSTDPESASLAEDDRRTVRLALSQLSERDQACLVLRHSGLSYAEVASAIGVSPGSVGTLLARAEERLRAAYLTLQEVPDGMRERR